MLQLVFSWIQTKLSFFVHNRKMLCTQYFRSEGVSTRKIKLDKISLLKWRSGNGMNRIKPRLHDQNFDESFVETRFFWEISVKISHKTDFQNVGFPQNFDRKVTDECAFRRHLDYLFRKLDACHKYNDTLLY